MSKSALQVFVLHDGQLVASEVFGDGSYVIGSDPGCDVVLPDESVAPRHVALQFRGGRTILQDLGSAVGTRVNGQPMTESGVTSADDINVGPYLLKLRQLGRKMPSGAAPSGLAGPAPSSNVVSIAAATRATSMPTPRPGGLQSSLARAMTPMAQGTPSTAAVLTLHPGGVLQGDADVDALMDSLDKSIGQPTPPQPLPPELFADEPEEEAEESLEAAAWVELSPAPVETTPSAPEVTVSPIEDEVSGAVVEDLSQLVIVPARVVETRTSASVPGMVPAPRDLRPPQAPTPQPVAAPVPPVPPAVPPVARVTATAPSAPVAQKPAPAVTPQATRPTAAAPATPVVQRPAYSTAAERLRVTVLWGTRPVLIRTFALGESVIAAASEDATLPLYGFGLDGETTLAYATPGGWTLNVPSGVGAAVRDSSGRWQGAAVAKGLAITAQAAARLSFGELQVELVREQPPAMITLRTLRDWGFLGLVAVLAVFFLTLAKLAPEPSKASRKDQAAQNVTYLQALAERKKPAPPRKEQPPPPRAVKPPPKTVAQAETLKAATDSIKAVDKVVNATKQIDNLVASLDKVKPLSGKSPLAGLGSLPKIPTLGPLSGGTGGGIGDLASLGSLTKGASALANAGSLGSGSAGSGKVRGVPISVPKKPEHVQGQIDRDALARVINEHVNDMRNCYERALLRDPNVGAGKVTLEWTIGGAGTVTDVSTKTSTLKSSEVVSCLLDVIRRLHFPKPDGGEVIVSYPILFNSVGY